MASPPSSQRKLDLAAPRPALRPTRRCGPFAKVLGQPPTRSPCRRGDRGRRRKAIPEPLRPTPSPSRWKIELDSSLSTTMTARPLRIFGGHAWAPVRGVTVAIGRPWPPLSPPPVVVAGGLSPCEGLSASPASRQRHVAATPGAPSTMVGRCDQPVPPAGSSRPVVAVVGSSPLDRSGMVRRQHRW